jgi:CRP-like cAMP-binding protein
MTWRDRSLRPLDIAGQSDKLMDLFLIGFAIKCLEECLVFCRPTWRSTSARQRVAHFLLELLTRLQVIGLADEHSFRMPVTQELIGDALGLSVPHVNRTLRQLRQDELVRIEEHMVILQDAEALAALADFEKSYLSLFRLPGLVAQS